MISTSSSKNSPVTIVSVGLVLALTALAATACQAPQEVRQGGEGEYCNGDDEECRAGLTCEDFICTGSESDNDEHPWAEDCDQMCDRLDACEASLDQCVGRCLNTTELWGEEAVDYFVACFVDDLSCDELQASEDPPQTCYQQIPIDETRQNQCDDFQSAAFECGASGEATSEFDEACTGAARTAGPDRWSDIQGCNEYIDETCQDVFECLNTHLDFEPELE